MKTEIFQHIDNIIKKIDSYKIEPIFSNEIEFRKNRKVSDDLTENEIIEIFTTLIAFSASDILTCFNSCIHPFLVFLIFSMFL